MPLPANRFSSVNEALQVCHAMTTMGYYSIARTEHVMGPSMQNLILMARMGTVLHISLRSIILA